VAAISFCEIVACAGPLIHQTCNDGFDALILADAQTHFNRCLVEERVAIEFFRSRTEYTGARLATAKCPFPWFTIAVVDDNTTVERASGANVVSQQLISS